MNEKPATQTATGMAIYFVVIMLTMMVYFMFLGLHVQRIESKLAPCTTQGER